MLIDGHKNYWSTLLKNRFRKTLGEAAERVVFLNRLNAQEFLSVLAMSEAVLDPPHFGGGNTSLETFAVGSPLVTLPGDFLRSRLSYGFYRRMGVLDLVAADADAYVRLALRLGTDPDCARKCLRAFSPRRTFSLKIAAFCTILSTFSRTPCSALPQCELERGTSPGPEGTRHERSRTGIRRTSG